MGTRYIITGDIHGCIDEFDALMDKVSLSVEQDHLIILGDLIDRGPNSYEVVKKVFEYRDKMGERFALILGNHEDMMLNYESDWYTWSLNGNEFTVSSFEENGDSFQNHIEQFRELPLYYKTERFTCVHGGVDTWKGATPETSSRESLIWDRNCVKYGLWNGPLVIAGHTPLKAPLIWENWEHKLLEHDKQYDLPEHGFLCIDTGCVYGGELTAAVIMDDKLILRAVKSQKEYF